MSTTSSPSRPPADRLLDTTGLVCPLPIIKTADAMAVVRVGEVLEVISTDFGILEDMPAWCNSMRQELLGIDARDDGGTTVYHVFVRRLR